MIHSGLRKLFLNNFKVVREECNRLLNHYVKELMRDLYDHLVTHPLMAGWHNSTLNVHELLFKFIWLLCGL